MNKHSIMYAAKLVLVMAMFLGLSGFEPVELRASDNNSDSLSVAQVKYEGATENLLTFSVKYPNPTGKYFTLEVRNEQSEVLFRHVYNSKDFHKKIYLVKTGEQAFVSFGIKAGKEVLTERFSIKPETQVINDLIVKRL